MVSNNSGKIQFSVVLSLVILFLISLSLFFIYSSYADARPVDGSDVKSMDVKSIASHGTIESPSRYFRNVSDKIDSEGSADVIIILEDSSSNSLSDPSSAGIQALNKSENSRKAVKDDLKISSVSGFSEDRKLGIINGYSGRLTKKGLENLKNSGLKFRVYEDRMMYIQDDVPAGIINSSDSNFSGMNISVDSALNVSVINVSDISEDTNIPASDIQPTVQSSLAIATSSVNANYSWNVLNITGSGVKVALIDTGIDYTHPDLGNCSTATFLAGNCAKIVGGYDFYNNDNDPMDDHVYGHGTHVAGILGANGAIVGVAPNASIYALKACSSSGSCPTSDVIAAMDWAKDHSIKVIGLSLGIYASYDDNGNDGKDPFSIAVDDIVDDGIVVVISAGNNGPGASTITTPGSSEKAVTVGAVDDKNDYDITDDSMWLESSRGPGAFGRLDPEMSAPGYQIQSTTRGNAYMELTGTSMASPFVSGAATLLLSAYPSLNPLQIRAILMQSTDSISGKLFERGTGELDIRRALTGKVYALVNHTDMYGHNVVDDRWEFIVTPYTTSYANMTIFNNNDYNVTFTSIIESLDNMDNSITLNISQLGMLSNVTIANNSNYTFNMNFTLANFSSIYAATYGGVIFLNGTGNNGTSNISKTLRIPLVITVPMMNYANINRTLDTDSSDPSYTNTDPSHEDVYFYAYYNNNSRDVHATINWPLASDWLSLYLYNSTGDFDMSSKGSGTNTQSVYTAKSDSFKWIRIDGYDFNTLVTFSMNVSELGNHAPSITSITDVYGSSNGSFGNGSSNTSVSLLFYRPNDVTINISYNDYDNDSVIITLNDSRYQLMNSSSNISSDGRNGYALFKRIYNSSMPDTDQVLATIIDPYSGTTIQSINILMHTSIDILSYYPLNITTSGAVFMKTNSTLNFTVDAVDLGNRSLYYYWSINGTLNSTTKNMTFSAVNRSTGLYGIFLLISNNASGNSTNESLSWNVYIDGAAPVINIQNPAASSIQNRSRISVNYTVNDSLSGASSCWYTLFNVSNASSNASNDVLIGNTTLNSCSAINNNFTMDIPDGNYTLRIYSNDTVGNSAYADSVFIANDSTPPIMSAASPSGDLGATTGVSLSVSTDENAVCRYSASDISYDSMSLSFDDYGNYSTEHTAGFGVNSGNAYTLYVRCSDMSNNSDNESTPIAFRIAVPSGGSSGGGGSGGGGSGGGGSGGGGGAIIEDPNVVTQTLENITSGSTEVDISKENISISKVTIDVNDTFYGVRIIVTRLNSSDVTYDDGLVYGYLQIDYDNIDPASLKGAKISFDVLKEWLENSNLSMNGVELVRYDSVYGWKVLSTELLTQDYGKVYYEAYSDQLGLFAIAHRNLTEYTEGPFVKIEEKNITDIPKVNSENSLNTTAAASGLRGFMDEAIAAINSAEAPQWLLIIIFSLFMVVVIIALATRQKSISKYGPELIKEANKEFVGTKEFNKIDNLSLKQEANILFRAVEEKPKIDTTRMIYRHNPELISRQQQMNARAAMESANRRRYMNASMKNLGVYKRK